MFTLRLTSSQRMALLDVLIESLRTGAIDTFVDCSQCPPVETEIADLIALVQNAAPEAKCS